MDEVLSCSIELNNRILESETYKNYIYSKNELAIFPRYKEMVDKFRQKQVEYEAGKVNGGLVDSNEEFALCNEFADICLISVCNDFFQAEMQLLELLKSVYSQICEGIEIDMAFMDFNL